MHDMVSFDYYANTYLGSLIPEKDFAALEKRAAEQLDRLCRTCRVEGGEDAKAMAVCAMAEDLYRGAGRRGVASASVGGVRVQYRQDADRHLSGQLYRSAAIYLDIYRGRELCKDRGLSNV